MELRINRARIKRARPVFLNVWKNTCNIVTRQIEPNSIEQEWGLSPGYPDDFATALTITPLHQLCSR